MSCICPTRNRPEWLPLAIQCWQSQTYPHRELLILADGTDVRNLLPDDPRIRYWHRSDRQTVGWKRNWLCEQARGALIAHWDDDDWSAPERLAEQVSILRDQPSIAVTGYRTILFYCVSSGVVYRYRGSGNYAVGTSLCFRRDWWRALRFADLKVGEDNDFVFRSREHLDSHDANGLMVARTLPNGTSPRQIKSKQWERVSADELPDGFQQ